MNNRLFISNFRMKKFVISISIFIGVFVIALVAVYFYLTYKIRNNAVFKINESTSCIVTGSSHSACSVDDSLIEHLENFSRSGELYCYTYIKIKQLLENNSNIKTVLVEFSNPFIYDDEEWLWSDKYIQFHYVTFSPFFSFDDNRILFEKHLKPFFLAYPFFVKDAGKKVLKRDYEYAYSTGGHEKKTNDMVRYGQSNNVGDREIGINLAFLDKIVDCCKERNVRLIFLRSPLHPDYVYWQTEEQFQQIRKERYSEVEFWDYGRIYSSDEYFADYQHLNQKGAEDFSGILARKLKVKS